MAYNRTEWLDHVVEYPNRYKEVDLGNGYVEETPAPGEIIQQGTPQKASNFNNLEEGVISGNEMADYLAVTLAGTQRGLNALKGEYGETTLTNTRTYPFNSTATSGTTVTLATKRDTTDYTVDVEVTEETGGCAGLVTVYDKLTNGFKLRFDGSAKSIGVRYTVRGGAY